MTELPQGWIKAGLSDLANIVMGQSPPSNTYNNSKHGLPFFQGKAEFGALYPTVKKYCSVPLKVAQAGDILISIRAPVGPTNLCAEQCCIGRRLAAIRPLGDIPNHFLLYYLRSIEPWLSEQGTGSTFSAISKGDLEQIDLPVPPINEQRRIVAKLEKLLSHVDAAQARLATIPRTLDRFRQSVLRAACSGRLTADWRERKQPKSADDLTLSDGFPTTWLNTTLGKVADIVDPNPSHRYPSYEDGSVPILSTQEFSGLNDWEISKAKLVPSSFYDERNRANGFFDDDIVFARKGRLGLARRPPRIPRYTFSHTIFLVRANGIAISEFLLWYLRQEVCVSWLLSEMNSNTGVPTLGKAFLSQLPVAVPPIAEQQEIVRGIEALFKTANALEARYRTAKAHVDKLTQSILAKAFRGELVPQDPTDEPASVLLEQIRKRSASEKGRSRPTGKSSKRKTATAATVRR